jgi:beta-glucanase (GH16 family)
MTGRLTGRLTGRGMGAVLLALVLGVGALGCSAPDPRPVDPRPVDRNGWRLVWSDEFDGAGLDPARWAVADRSTFGDGNGELACLMRRPENVSVEGGTLHLVARREAEPLPCGDADRRFPAGRRYSSAMISTQGLAQWTYGRFEVRARTPTAAGTSQGLWPAFWMRPEDGGRGELDVMELIGSSVPGRRTPVHHTIWYDYTRTVPNQTVAVGLPAGEPSDGMHVYALEWRPGELRWFVDDVLTYVRDERTTPWLREVFARPFFLRLNLAVGGTWPGAPTARTALPATLLVDHVRVYQPPTPP